jgi:hypothetical protein
LVLSLMKVSTIALVDTLTLYRNALKCVRIGRLLLLALNTGTCTPSMSMGSTPSERAGPDTRTTRGAGWSSRGV